MHKHSKEHYTLVTVLQHSMEPVLQSARGMTGLAAARRGRAEIVMARARLNMMICVWRLEAESDWVLGMLCPQCDGHLL